ncbi:MAG: Uma2 family endonuclease, partial [Bryobacterales bacterium]|nr:Uma2 family endonuclease [Bryobacterales bacterium]
PDPLHARVQMKLGAFFVSREQTHRTFAYSGLRLKPREGRVIIPDVAVFVPNLIGNVAPVGLAPFIAVEILSPDDRMSEVRNKLEEYADWGVSHIWLIEPHSKRLYLRKDGLHEVLSYSIPELDLHLTPADLFD